MSTRPWMPFYFNDFYTDTLGLGLDERGAYFLLILLAWRHGSGSVTGDMNELKAILKCCCKIHGHTFNRIIPKLLARYFELRHDGRFYQPRVVMELEKAVKLSAKQSQIASKRWSDYRHFKQLGNANAMPSQSHKKEKKEVGEKELLTTGITPSLAAAIKAKGWV